MGEYRFHHRQGANIMKWGIAFLILVIPLLASAQTQDKAVWEKIASTEGKTIYINLASYSSKGHVATIWALEDFAKPAPNASGQAYQSAKKLFAFDCPNRTYFVKHHIVHASTMGKGGLVSEASVASPSEPVPPGTDVESIYKWVCR